MATLSEILKGARLPERIVPVCVRGDLVAEMEAIHAEMKARPAQGAGDDRLGGDPNQDLKDALEALRVEMVAATVPFKIRAITPDQMDAIIIAHPPVDDLDKQIGYEFNAGRKDILRLSLVDPVIESDGDWDLLRASISLGQFEQLMEAANALAAAKPEAPATPFFPAASPSTRGSSAA